MRPWIEEIIVTEDFLRAQIKAGKEEAQHLLAFMLVQKALELRDCSLLDEAEEWYRKASNKSDELLKYFELEWPKENRDATSQIEMDKLK